MIGEKRHPERQHVQNGKRHIRRADLNRQKVIAKAALRRRGEHEKHHDRAVHGQQTEIRLRLDVAQATADVAFGQIKWMRISSERNMPTNTAVSAKK